MVIRRCDVGGFQIAATASAITIWPWGRNPIFPNYLILGERLLHEDADFFARDLPKPEHYRIALSYPSKTLILDIETTGLSQLYDVITLIGWSTNDEYNVYIKGDDPAPLIKAFSEAKAVVTFNGSLFDVPILSPSFQSIGALCALTCDSSQKELDCPADRSWLRRRSDGKGWGMAELRGGPPLCFGISIAEETSPRWSYCSLTTTPTSRE